jgi:hypothetical protein
MKEKTMRKFFALTTLACALAVLLSAACKLSTDDDVTGQTSIRRAIIRIGDNSSARSLVPTDAPVFTKYELVFTADGKDTIYRSLETSGDRTAITGGGYAIDLEEASWTIEASAFVSRTGGSFMEAARGTGSLTVSAANRNPGVQIYLAPLPMDGETRGILTWNLNLSGVSGSVSVAGTITRVVDGTPELGTDLPAGMSGSKELDSGYYILQFTLHKKDEGKYAGVYRAVHIYPGLTTKAEGADFTFTNDDFKNEKYLAGTVAITGVPYDRTVEWVEVQPYKGLASAISLGNAVRVAADNSWILSIPGNAVDVYLKVTMKLTDYSGVYNLGGIRELDIPDNGKKDIVISTVWNEITYTVTFNAGTGTGNVPVSDPVVLNGWITLPGQGDMTEPENQSFVGWRINGSENKSAGEEIQITGNTVCTARWGMNGPLQPKPHPVSVPFSSNNIFSYVERSGSENLNVYLVKAGTIEDVLIFEADNRNYFGGSFTWNETVSESRYSASSVETILSQTIANSTEETDSWHIEGAISGTYYGVTGNIKGEIGNTTIKQKAEERHFSTTSIVETVDTWSRTQDFNYTFRDGIDPYGDYRKVVYANLCHVYWEFKTSRDNQTLISFNPIVIVDTTSSPVYKKRLEYAASGGSFTYVAPSTKLPTPQDFWKTLSRPQLNDITTMEFPVRTEEKKIDDDRWFHEDTVYFGQFVDDQYVSLNIDRIRQNGYRRISFTIKLKLKGDTGWNGGVHDGDRYIGLFSSLDVCRKQWIQGDNNKDYKPYTFTVELPIDQFTDDRFIMGYMSQEQNWAGLPWHDWFNKDLNIQLVFKE